MQRKHLLAPAPNAFGAGNVQIPLKGMPPGWRVREFHVVLELDFLTGAAAVIIPGKELFRLVSNIEIGKKVKVSALNIHHGNWVMRGAEDYLPASIPATNATHFKRNVQIILPYNDQMMADPTDGMRETEAFRDNDEYISMDIAPFAGLDTGSNNWNNLTSITGTIRAWAVLERRGKDASGDLHLGYIDFATQQILIPPGLYTHLWLFKETAASITDAEVANIALKADGAPYSDVIKPQEFVAEWNEELARGGALHADSATAPVPGERITNEPSNAGAAASTVTFELIPIVWQPDRGLLTRALQVLQGGQIDLTGTLLAGRLGFRRYDARTESEAKAALARIGQPNASPKASTSDGSALPGEAAHLTRFFPLKG